MLEEAHRWFGEISVDYVPASAGSVVDEMLKMLDVLQPAKVDRSRSWIRSQHDWHDIDGLEITLVHVDDSEASVSIAVGKTQAIVAWLSAHEHIYSDDATKDRPWTTVVVDALAAILQGQYEIQDYYRGNRLVKTRIRDLVDHARVVSTTGNLLAIVPWPRARVVTRGVDFGVTH